MVDNFARVLGIEVMTSARALELRSPHRPAPATQAVLEGVRRQVPGLGPDRFLAPEVDLMTGMVLSGQVLAWAESVTGSLQ